MLIGGISVAGGQAGSNKYLILENGLGGMGGKVL